MKIKIIDLLNKIANGEEPPKKIRISTFNYVFEDYDYYMLNVVGDITEYSLFKDLKDGNYTLNDEVEILETTITNKQDKIEPLKIELGKINGKSNYDEVINELSHKINEIIYKVNDL